MISQTADTEYFRLANHILENGVIKENRTGINALTVAGGMFQYDMAGKFPLLTSRRLPFKSTKTELEFFLKGLTDKRWLQERGCGYWDEWCSPKQAPDFKSNEERLLWQTENPDLGPLGYSHHWRNWGAKCKPIPFIWTELDRSINVIPSDEPIVGKVVAGKYGEYVVISYDGKDQYHNKRFTVKFPKNGFVKNNLNEQQVEAGAVWNPYAPEICGVACVGEYEKTEAPSDMVEKLMNAWRQMVHRCYNTEHASYINYGAKNVYVANPWLIFANYLRDVQTLSGWASKKENWDEYQLDKDINGGACYSKENCLWVTREENCNQTSRSYYFDAISPNGQVFENNIGVNRFCRKHALDEKSVEASIQNETKTHGGWKFIVKERVKKEEPVGIDQVRNIVNTLKTNPNDRRMICSGWNPEILGDMALPPCHVSWQVTVINGKLNLMWYQRSVDFCCGLPANIASYALLLHLLAKEAGLKEGVLTGFLADLHIYEFHLTNLKEQLTRTAPAGPTIDTVGFTSVLDWSADQTVLKDYAPLDKLSFEIAV